MPQPVRMTITVAAVLRIFLDDITQPRYGYELMRATGYPSGKLYPVLARLERAGWLTKELEDIDPAAEGRPARRLYRLSAEAVPAAGSELAALSAQLQPQPGSRPDFAPKAASHEDRMGLRHRPHGHPGDGRGRRLVL